jgi:hypothetical protein
MTQFTDLGYYEGDMFKVVRDHHNNYGEVVTLSEDDGTHCPYFRTQKGTNAIELLSSHE